MSAELDRRNFLSLSLLASSSSVAFGGTGLVALLREPNAIARVHAILKQYLKVQDADFEVVARFVASLKLRPVHTEDSSHFGKLLDATPNEEALSTYVVQEFLVSTNYFAVHDGMAERLENLVIS